MTDDTPGQASADRGGPVARPEFGPIEDWRIGDTAYQQWIDSIEAPALQQLVASPLCIRAGDEGPLISIILPVFNTPADLLRQALDSVCAQYYQRWELCLVDDASDLPPVQELVGDYARRDPRIRVQRRQRNGGISRASNDALAMASGAYVALLDHDDVLAPHALLLIAAATLAHPGAGLLYSDSDELDVSGGRSNPFFKPDWNYDLLLGQNYFNHLTVYRTGLLREVGGFRQAFDSSQDYDLALRVIEQLDADEIQHIPHILYHWRVVMGSVARSDLARACSVARRAVAEHLARTDQAGEVVGAQRAVIFNRVVRPPVLPEPAVTALVYGSEPQQVRAAARQLESSAAYPALTVVEAVLPVAAETAAAQLNALCSDVSSEFLCLLHASVEVEQDDFFALLVSHLSRPGVAAVGAKMVLPEAGLSCGPLLLGIGEFGVAPCCSEAALGSKGYFARLSLEQHATVLHGAALALRTSSFNAAGGISAGLAHPLLLGPDICLKLGQRGELVVWTPYARVHSSLRMLTLTGESLPDTKQMNCFNQLWPQLDLDPFYNPNLNTRNGRFRLPSRTPGAPSKENT